MPASRQSRQSFVALFIALAACFAALSIGGALTRSNLDWYDTLAKPGFTPPNGAFPIAWSILYLLAALAAWLAWQAPGKDEDRKVALLWFGILLVAGTLWSVAFFSLHSPAFGLAVIMVFLVAIMVTIVLFDRLSRIAAVLLVPLLLWVSFAAGLNFAIWFLNRG